MLQGCNDTVTLWKKTNAAAKTDVWKRTVLPVKVKWRRETVRTATDKGAIISPFVVIIIPCGDYVFDGKNGDIVALGEHDVDITGVSPYTAIEIRQMFLPDIAEIKTVCDNTRDRLGKHYRVEGV